MSPDHIDRLCAEVAEALDMFDPPDRDLELRVMKSDNKRLRSACLKLEEELAGAYLSLQEYGEAVQPRMEVRLPEWT